ncbi:MAG: methyl-accepting chemotaxis protein [Proteobacteria bacterium]|nr:methyl-accepting chemotaxis protein [Pseudomonadota bacterium]
MNAPFRRSAPRIDPAQTPPSPEPAQVGATEQELLDAIDACTRAASGDLEVRLPYREDAPTLTRLHGAINALLDTTDAFVRESSASLEHVSRDSFRRRVLERGLAGRFRHGARVINAATRRMGERSAELAVVGERQLALAVQLESTVGGLAARVAAAAHELDVSAGVLEQSAERTAHGATVGATAAACARDGVGAVSRYTEQLRAEIASIRERTARSTVIAGRAVEGARQTETTAGGVADASRHIGDVVKLISNVASQTKLLALNATIEAARAGEAGKGFGVVAQEVKLLAGEAARATDDISTQIGAIQLATTEAVSATGAVVSTIQELYTVADAINRAVETQTSVATHIVRSAAEAEHGTSGLEGSMAVILDAANATRRSVGDLHQSAGSLAELASKLTDEVAGLVAEIRSASTRRRQG